MVLGKRFPEVAASAPLKNAAHLVLALAGRDTWNAQPVLWPVEGSDLSVPIEMAGLPVRENGAFAGFRGYGIARIEKAQRPEGEAPPLPPEPEPIIERREDRFGPAIAAALARTAAEATQSEPERAAVETPAATAAQAAKPALDEPKPAASPPAYVPAPAPPLPPTKDGETPSLTPSERNAFREIARALGRADDAPAPAAPPRAEPPALDPDGPPPASPRQMPAWIARRQQIRQDVRATPPAVETSQAASAAAATQGPVVPFETFQARLDRRGRDPVQMAAAQIVERLPLALLVMQEGKPIYANPAFLQLAGHADIAAFIAAGGADAFFTARPPDAAQASANAITVRDSTGRAIDAEASVQAIVWEENPAALMTFRQIDLRKSTERQSETQAADLELAAARREIAELRFVLDTATDGVLSLDKDGRILAANRSAEALFGFDQREITGEIFTTLLEPASHATALDYLAGLKADGVATIMNDGREVIGRERHGGKIPLFMTLGRMSPAGGDARFCAVLRDVTIWKKAEAELTEARRAAEDASANKTEYLARVSHEIRTPMNAIIGFADVMRNETFGPVGNEKYKGYIEDIHASGQHVVSLVNDLLDLSKIAAGKLDLTFGSVDLNQAVGAAVSMIQPQANAGRLIVRMQLANRLPPVVADERSIRQIVLNLLSNAAKFTEPGGQVVVSTTLSERGEAIIRVRDTGIGMSEDELRRAIEPFRQIKGPKASGGTGLGLPLTKALTEANRAAFQLSSEPGKGTLAEIVFPSTRVLAE